VIGSRSSPSLLALLLPGLRNHTGRRPFAEASADAVGRADADSDRAQAGSAGNLLLLAALGLHLSDRIPSGELPLRRGGSQEAAEPLVVVFPFENLGQSGRRILRRPHHGRNHPSGWSGSKGSGSSPAPAPCATRAAPELAEIAEELGGEYVLDGTVRWAHLPDGSSRVKDQPATAAHAGRRAAVGRGVRRASSERLRHPGCHGSGRGTLGSRSHRISARCSPSLPPVWRHTSSTRRSLPAHNRFKLGGRRRQSRPLLSLACARLIRSFARAWGAKASALASLNSSTVGSRENHSTPQSWTAQTFAAAERAIALTLRSPTVSAPGT